MQQLSITFLAKHLDSTHWRGSERTRLLTSGKLAGPADSRKKSPMKYVDYACAWILFAAGVVGMAVMWKSRASKAARKQPQRGGQEPA